MCRAGSPAAYLAAQVRKVDGAALAFPATQDEVRARVEQLGASGLLVAFHALPGQASRRGARRGKKLAGRPALREAVFLAMAGAVPSIEAALAMSATRRAAVMMIAKDFEAQRARAWLRIVAPSADG